MGRYTRPLLITLGAIVALLIVASIALPIFLNADSFRARIETTLTKSLGRKVSIRKVELAIWSGGLVAENVVTADDPKFNTQPFIQADSVKIGVELFPLIFSREVRISSFTLQSPKIQLLRAANGTWNYSTIGSGAAKSGVQDETAKQVFPNLTVGHIEVENGQITVGPVGTAGAPARVYQKVDLEVKDFGFTNAFSFTASANLPADGTIKIDGKAGPLNQQDASATPFSGHLEMKHIDPLAAGFVDASDGVAGMVDSIVLDATSNGQKMHVAKLIVDKPNLTLTSSNAPKQPKPATNSEGSTMLQNLSVDEAQITNGTVTLKTVGQTAPPAVYQQLNAKISNLTPTTSSPFSVTAQLPGGGALDANGTAGPFDQANNAATPVNAQVTLKHVGLGTTGILPPDAGIAGTADLQAKIQSNGQTLAAAGSTTITGLKLAANGQPSAKPVQVQFTILQNEQAMTGQIQQATITIGRAVINLAGTYQTSGPTTAVNIKVNGNAVPIDELEAFLPALGVHLPSGSRLQGGTLTTSLTVSGSTANPVISGPVQIDNTQLAGFDLGSKLQTLSKFTGGKVGGGATGSGTTIRSLSMVVQQAGGAIRTDKVALDVAGVGTATGAGSVSAAGALNYNMVLKLTGLTSTGGSPSSTAGAAGIAGALSGFIPGGSGTAGAIGGLTSGALKNGIPVEIGGTTSNPTFTPNLAGVLTSVGATSAQSLTKGQSKGANPTADPLSNALGGLLGKH
jgi:AsmA protein